MDVIYTLAGLLLILMGSILLVKNAVPLWHHRQARFEAMVMAKIRKPAPRPERIMKQEAIWKSLFSVLMSLIIGLSGVMIVLFANGLL